MIDKWLMALFGPVKALLVDGRRVWALMERILRQWIARCMARRGWTEHERNRDPNRCTPIRRKEFQRPDPLIYAQFYLMSLGFAVTWDNPDITLEKPGGAANAPPDPSRMVPSGLLEPDTEYDIVVRIWNGSAAAPVVGLPVRFGYLSFGMGVKSNPIGSVTTDLGVKGGPGAPAYARIRWRTPAQAGHYCIQVLLDWFDDLNPLNNYGQENTNVGVAQSPAHFTFRLGNQATTRQVFRFEADGFTLSAPIACGRVDRAGEAARRRAVAQGQKQPPLAGRPETFPAPTVRADQRREAHPLPEGWSVVFDPPTPALDPDEEIDIKVAITPPDDFKGRRNVNIHGFSERGLAGGVTLIVERH